MIKLFFKTAIRNLFKNGFYSILNIVGLAIGFAAFIYIATHVFNEFSFDRYNSKSDRIFRSVMTLKFGDTEEITSFSEMPLASAAKSDLPEVEESVRIYRAENMLTQYDNKKFFEDEIWYAEPSLFKIFDFKLLEGNPNLALNQPKSIVLSAKAATKYFGNEDPIGKSISIGNSKNNFIVTGILAPIPHNSHLQFDYLASFSSLPKEKLEEGWAQSISYFTYILVKKGTDIKSFQKKYAGFPMKYLEATVAKMGLTLAEFEKRGNYLNYELQPLKDIHLHSSIYKEGLKTAGNFRFLVVLGITGLLIMIIACFNFVNLNTSRAILRTKEIGVKKIIGSTRETVIYQILAEVFLQCLIALILAVFFLLVSLPLLNSYTELVIKPAFFFNKFTLTTIFILPILTTLLAGSYPAIFITSVNANDVLKGIFKTGKTNQHWRGSLVTFQFVVFIVLVFSTIVISNQVNLLQHKNPGYDKDNVLVVKGVFNIDYSSRKSFKNEILKNPNVLSASYSSTTPAINEESKMIYRIKGSDKSSYFNYMRVDADYQKTLKFKMKEGRFFSDDMGSEANNIVINDAAAKILGFKDFSQIVYCDNQNQDYKVIGIVNDFNMKSLREVSLPLIMQYSGDENFLSLRIQPGDISQVIKTTQEDWEKFNNEIPFEYYFLDKAFDAQYKSETRLGKLIWLFTLIAILIGCMGLLGLVSFNTTNRIKEIGIRKINGAKISEILTMLNRDFAKWVVIAFVIAMPIAYYTMNKWLESFAYKTELSWWIFALSGVLALGIALLTVSWQSWKAATRNPVEALRNE